MKLNRKSLFALAPLFIAAFVFIVGELLMSLWNWIAAGLFGLPRLTFWEAWGLLLLCRILFGSVHGGRGRRWEKLSPEERERLRGRLRSRWDCDRPGGDAPATS